jgi:septum formation inhibitor-activating ATPase MinD
LATLLEEAKKHYDYILLDTKGQLPASRISKLPKDALHLAVVTPDAIAVKNTGVLANDLLQYGIECRLIIDRFEKKNADGIINNIDEIVDKCSSRLIGIVPEDKKISSHRRVPFVYGKAASAIFRITARIMGQDVPLPKIKDIL